jgi:hypothetical protein
MEAVDQAALEARINTLDKDTARRVALLVVECHASVPLALRAVLEANTMREQLPTRQHSPEHKRLAHRLTSLSSRL